MVAWNRYLVGQGYLNSDWVESFLSDSGLVYQTCFAGSVGLEALGLVH